MKELKQKIENLVMGDNCPEHSKWVAEKIIEEVIKPIAAEAFEAGTEIDDSGIFFKNNMSDWMKEKFSVTSNKQ